MFTKQSVTSAFHALLLIATSIATGTCWACYAAPPEQLIDPAVQVSLATDVTLATVVNITPRYERYDDRGDVDYQFVVLKRLAGPDQQFFSISGRAPGRSRDTTFDNHRDETFWHKGGGRVKNEGDCAIHPDFVVGKTYLVFRGAPTTRRSFEEIAAIDARSGDEDKWLSYVQTHIRRDYSDPAHR
jgi:hypothetical protein